MFPQGQYKTIYIDPPWPERGGGKIKRGADRHYALISRPCLSLHSQIQRAVTCICGRRTTTCLTRWNA